MARAGGVISQEGGGVAIQTEEIVNTFNSSIEEARRNGEIYAEYVRRFRSAVTGLVGRAKVQEIGENEIPVGHLIPVVMRKMYEGWYVDLTLDSKNVNPDGTLKPRWRETTDARWAERVLVSRGDSNRDIERQNAVRVMSGSLDGGVNSIEYDTAYPWDFEELPMDWQEKNRMGAEQALGLSVSYVARLLARKLKGSERDFYMMGSAVHDAWLGRERRGADGNIYNPTLGVPFEKLNQRMQILDLRVALIAVEVLCGSLFPGERG